KLEKLLSVREKVTIPEGEHVEEVNMVEWDRSQESASGRRGEAYDEDHDEDHSGPQ
ncbi:hypothetical protein ACJMK2_010081, partial [Sinanodonta woodiana]